MDTFTYTVQNIEGNSEQGSVILAVLPVNDPPTAPTEFEVSVLHITIDGKIEFDEESVDVDSV